MKLKSVIGRLRVGRIDWRHEEGGDLFKRLANWKTSEMAVTGNKALTKRWSILL